jgi:L-lactate dehydrogenase complex protein LldG
MSARHAIFTALRRLRPEGFSPDAVSAQAKALAESMRACLPPLEFADPIENFCARATAEKVGATVERIGAWRELPQAVIRYARDNQLPLEAALQPDPRLQALDWGDMRVDAPLKSDTVLAVGAARGGVGETGSLVFHSAPEAPTLFGFMPLHHLVVVEAQTIVARFEDYSALEQGQSQPRNVNFITGASGTTDIEGVLARGAHGPRRLHIVIRG